MKKIIVFILCWPLCSYPIYAQKEKPKDNSSEIIIIKNGDKEKKLTIETKDGELFINGKPSAEYKDDDVSVIRQKYKSDRNFIYTPGKTMNLFDGEKKAFLGVTTEKSDDGAKVTNVSTGSAAEKAGLKEGDIITKVGNKKITDPDELSEAVKAYKPKDDIAISYKRDGKNTDAKATLGEKSFGVFSYNGSNMNFGDLNFKMPKIAPLPNAYSMAWGYNRGRLGLRIEDTDNDSGVKITDVSDESAAAKAGLKENDVITEVNGTKVKDVNEVRKALADVKDKTSYNIKAKRNGADMNFEIKIPKRINKADL